MKECGECGADLDPAWKFCIYCGTRVAIAEAPDTGSRAPSLDDVAPAEPIAAGPLPALIPEPPIPAAARSTMPSMLPLDDPRGDDTRAGRLPANESTEIPSAFRIFPSIADADEGDDHDHDRPKFDLPLVLGISIGVFGLVAVIAAFVIIVGGG